LVDDLLDVARITSGRLELQRKAVDLGKLVDHCMAVFSERLPDHRLELFTTSVTVDGDSARLEQIVTNLLDNAMKYTPPGGAIGVRVTREGDWEVLRVRDSGIGIEPDLLLRIFDLFSQGDRSLDRARGGLGLGLAVVKRLVPLHGGRVSTESAGPDQGSEFVVQLPVAGASAAAAPTPDASPALRPHRVADPGLDHPLEC
jgi:signal transduction histidine kinase